MNKSLLTILQYLFFLGLGILFVWLTVKDITPGQWNHIKYSLANARHWLIVPVILMLLLAHYSRALRWKILMEPLGYAPSTFNTWAAVMIGYLVNAGVPRLGEVVKCTLLSRYEKVRADKLVGTIVMERAVDLVCLILLFIIALIFQGNIIGDFTAHLFGDLFKDDSGNVSYTRISLTVTVIVVVFLVVYFLLKKFGHIDAVAKVKNVIRGIWHGLSSIRLIKHKGLFLFHTLLIWTLYLLSTTAGIYALHETEHLGIPGGLTTLAIGSVGMIATPGGIGAYPFLVEQLMLLYKVPEETGAALGWLLWSVQTVIVLAGGVIFSGLFSYYNKNKKSADGQQHSS